MKLRLVLVALAANGCAADIKAPPAQPASLTAIFDPTASPAAIPLPNDLAKTGGDGTHLNVPDAPTDSPAQVDFNHYLNTLDGFPSSTPGSFSFSAAIDPTTLTVGTPQTNGSVVIFNATTKTPLGPNDYKLALSADGTSVTITPTLRWQSAAQYVVLLFGGSDAAGLKGAMGETVLASPAFFFLRSPVPVEAAACADGTFACACPADVVAKGDPTDPTCKSVITGLPDAEARLLEGPRQTIAATLGAILPFAGGGPRDPNNVVLLWSFTIASAPMAVFDPTRGDVPFPNDALINQTTQLVNVPIAAGDPEASIKMGLNALDGFSTTAPETLDIDFASPIDPATVVASGSALLLAVTTTAAQPGNYGAAPVFVNQGMTFAGQIAIQSNNALESDQTRYAAAVSTDVKDSTGRNLTAPPVMVLVRGKNPLVDAMGHSTVPGELADADAQQLEVLRQAEAPLFDTLDSGFMLPREKIAAAWTFTTESIVRPLSAMNALPTLAKEPTDVSFKVYDAAALGAVASQLKFPVGNLGAMVIGQMTTQRAADPTTGVIAFARDTLDSSAHFTVTVPAGAPVEPVKFIFTLPKTAGPWPVAILQHGLGRWRGDMTLLADGFAADGIATIMMDLPFHGARSACTADTQCAGGAAGSCNLTTGVCTGGLAFTTVAQDALACTIEPITGDATDCLPLASGAAFVNPNNLFSTRDNLRQFVADAAQLIRVLSDQTNANGLFHQLSTSGLAEYDATKLSYLGQSLGGICGAVFLSVAPEPQVGVLNVTGGHLFDIIADGSYAPLVQPLLMSLGIQPDTAAYLQLAATARWALDPVDPFAVARHLVRSPVTAYTTSTVNAQKVLIQQEAGMDTTILPQFQQELANEIFGGSGTDASGHVQGTTTPGGTVVSTFFAAALHGSLLASPAMSATASEQAQAIGWISSSGATISSP